MKSKGEEKRERVGESRVEELYMYTKSIVYYFIIFMYSDPSSAKNPVRTWKPAKVSFLHLPSLIHVFSLLIPPSPPLPLRPSPTPPLCLPPSPFAHIIHHPSSSLLVSLPSSPLPPHPFLQGSAQWVGCVTVDGEGGGEWMVCGGSMAPTIYHLASNSKIATLPVPPNVATQAAIFAKDRVSAYFL